MAGTRTNALVVAGAAAFVMAGFELTGDLSAPGRVASYLGRRFSRRRRHFKDGPNVQGMNTAATIWRSAAIGVLCGLGHVVLPLTLTAAVLMTNIAFWTLTYRLHPYCSTAPATETLYAITMTFRSADKTHLRPLLLTAVSQAHAILQAIRSDDESAANRTRLRAEITMSGRRNKEVEQIAMRLSLEPGVTSLSWAIVPAAME